MRKPFKRSPWSSLRLPETFWTARSLWWEGSLAYFLAALPSSSSLSSPYSVTWSFKQPEKSKAPKLPTPTRIHLIPSGRHEYMFTLLESNWKHLKHPLPQLVPSLHPSIIFNCWSSFYRATFCYQARGKLQIVDVLRNDTRVVSSLIRIAEGMKDGWYPQIWTMLKQEKWQGRTAGKNFKTNRQLLRLRLRDWDIYANSSPGQCRTAMGKEKMILRHILISCMGGTMLYLRWNEKIWCVVRVRKIPSLLDWLGFRCLQFWRFFKTWSSTYIYHRTNKLPWYVLRWKEYEELGNCIRKSWTTKSIDARGYFFTHSHTFLKGIHQVALNQTFIHLETLRLILLPRAA